MIKNSFLYYYYIYYNIKINHSFTSEKVLYYLIFDFKNKKNTINYSLTLFSN